MTPKVKAQQLFDKFNKDGLHQISSVINRTIRKQMIIQCCLIVVDEIIKSKPSESTEYNSTITYWQEVRKKIELIK